MLAHHGFWLQFEEDTGSAAQWYWKDREECAKQLKDFFNKVEMQHNKESEEEEARIIFVGKRKAAHLLAKRLTGLGSQDGSGLAELVTRAKNRLGVEPEEALRHLVSDLSISSCDHYGICKRDGTYKQLNFTSLHCSMFLSLADATLPWQEEPLASGQITRARSQHPGGALAPTAPQLQTEIRWRRPALLNQMLRLVCTIVIGFRLYIFFSWCQYEYPNLSMKGKGLLMEVTKLDIAPADRSKALPYISAEARLSNQTSYCGHVVDPSFSPACPRGWKTSSPRLVRADLVTLDQCRRSETLTSSFPLFLAQISR